MRVTAHHFSFVAALSLVATALWTGCEPNATGATCFAPEHGPSAVSCAGFQVGLSCPVDVQPWYSCVCTQSGSSQSWVCMPSGSGAGGAGAGGSGAGGSGSGGSGTGGVGSGGSDAGEAGLEGGDAAMGEGG